MFCIILKHHSWAQEVEVILSVILSFTMGIMYAVSVLQRLHGEIGRTISDVQKRDKQTDKNSTFLAAPVVYLI